MKFLNTINKLCDYLAIYISLENCRICGKVVKNHNPTVKPQSICRVCWGKLACDFSPTIWKTISPVSQSQYEYDKYAKYIKYKGAIFPLVSGGMYSGLIRKLVIRLKQKEDFLLAADLVQLILQVLNKSPVSIPCINAFVAPMPLHKNKVKSRGFNQSELLAQSLSQELGIKYVNNALLRCRDTRSQRGLNKSERLANVSGAFKAKKNLVAAKVIILIDDVYTSGATMNEAVLQLYNAGAASVIGFCVAHTPLPD